MIEVVHADLSISARCRLLSISRSSFYYAPQPESDETLALMQVIDASFLDMPWYGSRRMVRHLRRQGVDIGRRRVRRLMTKMGLSPIYQRPHTSDPHPQHRIYLHAFETGSEMRVGLTRWIGYYNADRPHSGLAGQTPDETYRANEMRSLAGLGARLWKIVRTGAVKGASRPHLVHPPLRANDDETSTPRKFTLGGDR